MTLDLLAHVRDESARFAAVLREADPAARVPTCPEWDAADLFWHLTEVHHMWAEVVGRRITDGDVVDDEVEGALARPADRDAVAALYDRTTDDLLRALAAADDSEPVWTWASDQSVGFVRRFQAHEALMHRVDAELAAGLTPSPLPVELADDGIDVVLRFGKTWRPGWADWQLTGPVGRVHATDTDHRWTVRIGSWSGHSPDTGKTYDGQDALELVADHSETDVEPDFSVHATAAELDAWLWCRPGFGEVSVQGDAERFTALVKDGMQ